MTSVDFWSGLARELSLEELVAILRDQPGLPAALEALRSAEIPDDPVTFAWRAWGIRFWGRQREILQAVQEHRFVAVETGHGVGKSFAAACLVVWWMSAFPGAQVITMAPTANLVQNILWRKIRELHRTSLIPLPGRVLETPRWEVAPHWFAIGLSPRRGRVERSAFTAAQGFHGDKLLVVLDEAGGIPRELFETAESLVTSQGSRLLAIGNPVGESGPFYEATRAPSYVHLRISCLEHPNVAQRQEIIPGAVSWEWVKERFQRWATPCDPSDPDSLPFDGQWWKPSGVLMARVLGIPPREADMALVTVPWLEAARMNDLGPSPPVVLGIDPAHGGGARTAFVVRAGGRVEAVVRRDFSRIEEIGRMALSLREEHRVEAIFVDGIGIGAGVVDWLRERGADARGILVSGAARKPETFANLRSELFWRLREALKEGELALPKDELLDEELMGIRYDFDPKGRIALEPKKVTEDRIRRSMDSADALALTMWATERAVKEAPAPLAEAAPTISRWAIPLRHRSLPRRWRP